MQQSVEKSASDPYGQEVFYLILVKERQIVTFSFYEKQAYPAESYYVKLHSFSEKKGKLSVSTFYVKKANFPWV